MDPIYTFCCCGTDAFFFFLVLYIEFTAQNLGLLCDQLTHVPRLWFWKPHVRIKMEDQRHVEPVYKDLIGLTYLRNGWPDLAAEEANFILEGH